MKTNNTSPFVPDRQKQESLMISPRSIAPGAHGNANITTFKSNYRSSSSGLTQLNSFINWIDARWGEYLPATQAAWQFAAASMPGAKLCQCAFSTFDGKKLHRQQNIAIAEAGGPINAVPPSTSGWSLMAFPSFDFYFSFAGAGNFWAGFCSDPSGLGELDLYYRGILIRRQGFSLGQVNENLGGGIYPWDAGLPVNVPLQYCTNAPGGLPSFAGTTIINYTGPFP